MLNNANVFGKISVRFFLDCTFSSKQAKINSGILVQDMLSQEKCIYLAIYKNVDHSTIIFLEQTLNIRIKQNICSIKNKIGQFFIALYNEKIHQY